MLACNFIKKRFQNKCFPVKFAKLLRTFILKNICKLLLKVNNDNYQIVVSIKNIILVEITVLMCYSSL